MMGAVPVVPEPMIEIEMVPDTAPPVAVPTVELAGRRFPIRGEGVPLAYMIELAVLAKRERAEGSNSATSMDMLVIMQELLQSIITEEAWPEFWAHAKRSGTDAEGFQAIIGQATEARAARPTQPSSGSPGGPPTTGPNSAGGSSALDLSGSSIRQGDPRVQAWQEQRGRPDLALVVQRAREASTAS